MSRVERDHARKLLLGAATLLVLSMCGGPKEDAAGGRRDERPRRGVPERTGDDASIGVLDEVPSDAAAPTPRRVTIAAVGDILFGRYHPGKKYSRVPRIEDPFFEVAPILRRADIAFGNFENPVRTAPARFHTTRSLTFRADPADAEILAGAGFDVVSLANNHMRDLGSDSAPLSRRAVEDAGLLAVGAGATREEAFAPLLVEHEGIRIAFVARTVWLQGIEEGVTKQGAVALVSSRALKKELPEAVRRARADLRADFVIVSLHWGWEYKFHPTSSQRATARAAIDAGADLVLGHHPHVIQDMERHGAGVIIYSLGNFLFDTGARGQRKSVILEVTLERDGDERRVVDVTLHPILSDRKTHAPRLARGDGYRSWARQLAKFAPDFTIAPPPPEPAKDAAPQKQ